MLTALIYRGEVDHKFAAVYAPQDRSLTWCWINLMSYKTTLGYEGIQWDGPVWTPHINQQVWCRDLLITQTPPLDNLMSGKTLVCHHFYPTLTYP